MQLGSFIVLVSRSQWPGKSKVWVYGFSLVENAGSKDAGSLDVCLLCVCCVLSDRGVCGGQIVRPEQSYLLWCVQMRVIEESYGGGCRVMLNNSII